MASFVMSLVTVCLRFYVRVRLVKGFGKDDWLMIWAMVTFAFYSAFAFAGIVYGMSRKSYVVVSTVYFFFAMFQCTPIHYFWNKNSGRGTCFTQTTLKNSGYVFGAFSITTNLTLAVLPMLIVARLKMRIRTRVGLSVMMALGCLASGAVVVRYYYMSVLPDNIDVDLLMDTTDVAIWKTVEQALTITAGSLATLQPLVKLIGHKMGLADAPISIRRLDSYPLGAIGVRRGQSAYGQKGLRRDLSVCRLAESNRPSRIAVLPPSPMGSRDELQPPSPTYDRPSHSAGSATSGYTRVPDPQRKTFAATLFGSRILATILSQSVSRAKAVAECGAVVEGPYAVRAYAAILSENDDSRPRNGLSL
ncbi:hypothetical protein B0H63DRAFT_446092 [Podospora didyma]|uniref:Rhodopsin domain-containing protein n=1 Tax=Podospora didyma TaxID=330526 RepID=A0AAE0U3S1_9PEZI|nr:hypothetical protein B0H63DRAFT_446092 [Podospora didyma]